MIRIFSTAKQSRLFKSIPVFNSSLKSPNSTKPYNIPLSVRMASSSKTPLPYDAERASDLKENIEAVQREIDQAWSEVGANHAESSRKPRLVAVSKLKPASDIQALYDAGHRHFGENYIQEMVDKSEQLPDDIKWHFIGNLQSNKTKVAAGVQNLYVLETLSSIKTAGMLEKAVASHRPDNPLNVYLQVNTSSEDTKSGIEPISDSELETLLSDPAAKSDLLDLAIFVITECPHLRLHGLMTIGSFTASHDPSKPNPDFLSLKSNRSNLVKLLKARGIAGAPEKEEDLELSMGMSADFVAAVKEGSSGVRVGTRIFGERPKKVKA